MMSVCAWHAGGDARRHAHACAKRSDNGWIICTHMWRGLRRWRRTKHARILCCSSNSSASRSSSSITSSSSQPSEEQHNELANYISFTNWVRARENSQHTHTHNYSFRLVRMCSCATSLPRARVGIRRVYSANICCAMRHRDML